MALICGVCGRTVPPLAQACVGDGLTAHAATIPTRTHEHECAVLESRPERDRDEDDGQTYADPATERAERLLRD